MRRSRSLAVGIITASLVLAGCQSGKDSTSTTENKATDAPAASAEQQGDGSDKGSDPVKAVLAANPQVRDIALEDITGDGTMEILTRYQDPSSSLYHVSVYSADGTFLPASNTDDGTISDGAASAGGARYNLQKASDGNGLVRTEGASYSPSTTSTFWTVSDNSLVPSDPPAGISGADIEWYPISTIPASGGAGGNATGNAGGTAPAPHASGQAPAGQSDPSGAFVFSGTVQALSTSQAMAIQDPTATRPPNGEPESNIYYVLVLDSPVEVVGMAGDGSGPRAPETVTHVSLGKVDKYQDDSAQWQALVGSHTEISTTLDQRWWPSDTRMPIGMLGIKTS